MNLFLVENSLGYVCYLSPIRVWLYEPSLLVSEVQQSDRSKLLLAIAVDSPVAAMMVSRGQ